MARAGSGRWFLLVMRQDQPRQCDPYRQCSPCWSRQGHLPNLYFTPLFFFSSRRRHTRYWRDWSSDVCSSDLPWQSAAAVDDDAEDCQGAAADRHRQPRCQACAGDRHRQRRGAGGRAARGGDGSCPHGGGRGAALGPSHQARDQPQLRDRWHAPGAAGGAGDRHRHRILRRAGAHGVQPDPEGAGAQGGDRLARRALREARGLTSMARIDPRNVTQYWWDRHVSGLSLLQADFTTHTYPPHSHDAFVIAITEDGGSVVKSRGLVEEAHSSRLLVFNPAEPHAGWMGRSRRWRYRSLYLERAAIAEVARGLGIDEVPYFTQNIFADADLIEGFLALHRALEAGRDVFAQRELLISTFGTPAAAVRPRRPALPRYNFRQYGSAAVRDTRRPQYPEAGRCPISFVTSIRKPCPWRRSPRPRGRAASRWGNRRSIPAAAGSRRITVCCAGAAARPAWLA